MPVDISTYPTAAPAQNDPLAMIGKVLQIQGAQQALQNQQMEFKARQAMGPILQQSIDPQTGELDINKFLVHGAANPDVAWKMPEITLQMIQRQNTQADTVIKQLAANSTRYKAMGDAAGSLVALGEESAAGKVKMDGSPGTPGISSKQIASTLSTLVGENGLIDAKDAAEILAKTASMNDAQRFQFIKNFANSARGVEKTMGDIYGAIAPHSTGGGTALVQNRPLLGQARTVGTLENTPTPAEMNATVPGVNAQGQPIVRPRVQAAPMVGGSGAPIAGSGQAPAPTGLSPQETKLQEERAKTANTYDEDLQGANAAAQETRRVLTAIKDEIKNFKPGGGIEVRSRLASLAQSVGAPQKVVDEIAGGDYGSIQAVQKLANLLATSQMKISFGPAQRLTNMDFSAFTRNNIRGDTDPRAIDKMITFLESGAKRLQIQSDAHQWWKQGHRPPGYEQSDMSSFGNYWTKELDKLNTSEKAK